MTINARNPVYMNADGTMIDVEYEHPEYGWIPFTATADDIEQLGRDIYAAAMAGAYGEIAPYVGPSEEEILEQEARAKRDGLLRELDAIVSNPLRWGAFTEAEQQELADYRQALLDVPQQEGFPTDVVWPTDPIEG